MTRLLPGLLALPLALTVLAGCTATSGAGSTSTSTTTATTTATTTVTATPSPSTSDSALAARLVTLACQDYQYAGTVSAAESSGPLDRAASTGTSAAVLDTAWKDLAGALAFIAALPLTDVPAADRDLAATQIEIVTSRCSAAGVTVG